MWIPSRADEVLVTGEAWEVFKFRSFVTEKREADNFTFVRPKELSAGFCEVRAGRRSCRMRTHGLPGEHEKA